LRLFPLLRENSGNRGDESEVEALRRWRRHFDRNSREILVRPGYGWNFYTWWECRRCGWTTWDAPSMHSIVNSFQTMAHRQAKREHVCPTELDTPELKP
jgi:hypothetical protein